MSEHLARRGTAAGSAASRPGAGSAASRPGGLVIAAATAVISGVSVLVNSYGVHDFANATVYTTAKNLVAAVLLVVLAAAVPSLRRRPGPPAADRRAGAGRLGVGQWIGLAYVGVVGGGLAFALFFEGLARTGAVPGAFVHDTLVVWVALCCWPLLGERLSGLNVAAVVLLAGGEVAVSGGLGHLSAGLGTLLVLLATLCWAAETVVAKRLLAAMPAGALAVVRMGVGVVSLVAYLAVRGELGELGALDALDAHQLGWVLVTGCLLAGYVATWMAALARARAVDVTSVLVASVALTALLEAGLGRVSLGAGAAFGTGLVAAGTVVLAARWPRRRAA